MIVIWAYSFVIVPRLVQRSRLLRFTVVLTAASDYIPNNDIILYFLFAGVSSVCYPQVDLTNATKLRILKIRNSVAL